MDRQFIIYNINYYGRICFSNVYRSCYWYELSHLELHQIWQKVDRQFIILVMELITIFMGLSAVISASFAIWLNTKSGQKWIDEL